MYTEDFSVKTIRVEMLFYFIDLQKAVQYLGKSESVLLSRPHIRMWYGGCWYHYRLSERLHARVLIDEDANATVGGLFFFHKTTRMAAWCNWICVATHFGAGLQNTVYKTQREREEWEVMAHQSLLACYLSLQATAGLMTFSSQTEAELLLRGK